MGDFIPADLRHASSSPARERIWHLHSRDSALGTDTSLERTRPASLRLRRWYMRGDPPTKGALAISARVLLQPQPSSSNRCSRNCSRNIKNRSELATTVKVMLPSDISAHGPTPHPSALSTLSSGSSLPYLSEIDHVSDSDSEDGEDSCNGDTRMTLDGKGMYSRADMDNDGRIDVLL